VLNSQNDPISPLQLAAFDGKDASKPIYVAIKGKVFDVTAKREMYGPGAGYNIFAGKDASKGLGRSSGQITLMIKECLRWIPRMQSPITRLCQRLKSRHWTSGRLSLKRQVDAS